MNELFKNIDETSKNGILQGLEAINRKYEKNKIILSTVKTDDIVCLILAGHIQVIKNDVNGNHIIIEDLYEGDIFGSISANISSSDFEIVTKEDSNIIVIELDNIYAFNANIPSYNQFIKNVIRVLYDKIKEFNNRIEIITNKSIRDKLLAYFRINAKSTGSRIIYLPFTYSDLADYLAINRSAMAREIRILKDEGLIETKGKKIKLNYFIS